MNKIVLQNEPIDVHGVLDETGTASDGAIVSFVGRVRNAYHGKTVLHIEYESYNEMARKEIKKAVDAACEKWEINNCLVIHRFGRVEIGEATAIIAVAAPHSKDAFQAVQYVIDAIKKKVPIWKKEYYSDGSSWINEK
jgi:molybdopterin synthase catalytic subunit